MGLILILFGMFSSVAHGLSFDGNVFYFSDSITASSDSTYSRTVYDFALTIDLDKKGRYFTGWSYGAFSSSDPNGSDTVTFSNTEMGPQFGVYFDKGRSWVFIATYYFQSTGKYNDGSSEEEWRGTSYKVSTGYRGPVLEESMFAGVFLNYYTASYSESLTGTTTLTSVSYGKSSIYPSITFSYRFGN